MRWKSGRRSDNVEDRRGMGGGFDSGPMGRIPMRMGRKGLGGGLGTIVLVLAAMYFGVDPTVFLGGGPGTQGARHDSPAPRPAAEQQMADFVSVVLADTEDTWHQLFRERQGTYREPKLVLFSGAVRSACGFAQAAMGPFYCPADQKVYIDLSFYEDLRRQYGAPGDFAQAYVIAHEIGHHVQTLTGISEQVQSARRKLGEEEANQLSVRQELQADCLAGVWAHHAQRARNILEQGDLEEALIAAAAIGDDRLQQRSRGYVTPDSFTHGSSAQRVKWFRVGLEKGSLEPCGTFGPKPL